MAEDKQITLAFDIFSEPVAPEKKPAVTRSPKKKKEMAPVMPVHEGPVLVKKSTRGRKSIRVLEREAGLVDIPEDEELFSKQYYAMNEVAAMFRVTHSLLRYWANEFDGILKPRKNRKGDRHFRPEDIKSLQLIYYLLRQKKYTLDGAKDYLKNKDKAEQKHKAVLALEKIKSFLLEIRAGL